MTVLLVFAVVYLKEKMAWNYAVSFALLIAAVVVAFMFKPVAARRTEKTGELGIGLPDGRNQTLGTKLSCSTVW